MKRLMCFLVGALGSFVLLAAPVLAAPLTDVPTTLTQPDGTVLTLYSSGDEFFNYIHDAQGHLVMRREDGWYVYAQDQDGAPAATGDVVRAEGGEAALFSSPRGMKREDVDLAAHPELARSLENDQAQGEAVYCGQAPAQETWDEPGASLFGAAATQPRMANLVIFIRFKGEAEFISQNAAGDPIAPIAEKDQIAGLPTTVNFGESYRQVSRYMQTVSNGQFDVQSTFLTADSTGQTITSYEDIYPRSYYEGISGSEMDRFYAEMNLLERAVASVAEALPQGLELDYNNDGMVDNITFIVSGATAGWSDLLWPHSWAMQQNKIFLPNWDGKWKQCYQFNFNFANPRYAGIGVLSHELLHAVGYPDLYRYDYSGDPVGRWDAMGSTDYADPQFLGAYLKDAYTSWGRLGRITESGTYTLWPLGTQPTGGDPVWEGYQIPTGTAGESICVEYRKNGRPGEVTEDNVPQDGLLVYRANRKTTQGNRNGTVNGGDEVYVFRPGDTAPNAGTDTYLDQAALSGAGRTSVGAQTGAEVAPEETLYLDCGVNSGIVIDQVEELSDGRISFRVSLEQESAAIQPGRYDVDGGDYFISIPGDYTFYGVTSRHRITVGAGVKDVDITLEGAVMDLSALSESYSPLSLRAGSQVSVLTQADSQGQGTLLSGGQYMPGILVEQGAGLTLTGSDLRAMGGTGAPGVGGDAFNHGGHLHLKELTATLSGGAGFRLSSGNTLLTISEGSSALGGGFRQCTDGIIIENCDLEINGGAGVQSISTSYLDVNAGEYVAGGDILIRDSAVRCQGGIDSGAELRVERSELDVSVSVNAHYAAGMNATELLRLEHSQTRLDISGYSSTGTNRETRDTCRVEVLGGSLEVRSMGVCIAGTTIAMDATARVAMGTTNTSPVLAGPWSEEGLVLPGTIGPLDGGAPGVYLQGTFDPVTASRGLYALADAQTGARQYAWLPAGTQNFVVSIPGTGSYRIVDEREYASDTLKVQRTGVNTVGTVTLQAPVETQRQIDVGQGPVSIQTSGAYVLYGVGTQGVTVAPGLEVTLYLNGVELTPAQGAALTIGQNTKARIFAKRGTENHLAGASGAPALASLTGSQVTLAGSGAILARGGAGCQAVRAEGMLWVDQPVRLVAISDQATALTRSQGDQEPWGPANGADPVVLRATLARSVQAGDTVSLVTQEGSYPCPAPAGGRSLFGALPQTGRVKLALADGSQSDPLSCELPVNVFENVVLHTEELEQGGVLDLSKDSYIVTRNGAYTVTGETTSNTVRVAPGVVAVLRLDGVTADRFYNQAEPAGIIDLGANSTVTVELAEGTDNILRVNARGTGPLSIPAIHVPANARLTVRGEGSLTLAGGVSAACIGAGKRQDGGSILIQGGRLVFEAPEGSGNSIIGLGGSGSQVEITGGTLIQQAHYGGVLGGDNSRVTIRGGVITWATGDASSIGGNYATVVITGGEVNVTSQWKAPSIGGAGSDVSIRGGQIRINSQSDQYNVSIGGSDAKISITGGSITGRLGRAVYSGLGALGGQRATASVGGDASVFLRYASGQSQAVANEDLFDLQSGGYFLDLRFREPLAEGQALTLTHLDSGAIRTLEMEAGDAGFFVRLEPGVWELSNAAGGFGGGYDLADSGVTAQGDVTFDRYRGVYFSNKTVEYSGGYQYLEVTGLPDGVSATYQGNGQREPGTYTVTAHVPTAAGDSYTLSATLTITKAPLRVTGIRADSRAYNGNDIAAGSVLYTGAKGNDRPQFSASFRFDDANAGVNKTVRATGVRFATNEWERRYILEEVPAQLTTQADITPLEVRLYFESASLLQMAGQVVPVQVESTHSGVGTGDIRVVYTVDGMETATPPNEVGAYSVTATIDHRNFTGSATATLTVQNGYDLRLGNVDLTAGARYLITSGAEETANRVSADWTDFNDLYLYLFDVDVTPPAGYPALSVANSHNAATWVYPQGGTCVLRGGAGAPAVSGSNIFFNGDETAVLMAQDSTCRSDVNGPGGWMELEFQSAPDEDVHLTLRVDQREIDLPLKAGYRYVQVRLPQRGTAELLDQSGQRIRIGSMTDSRTKWSDLPLEAPGWQTGDIDVSKGPYTITQNGKYRVHGVYSNKTFAEQSTLITVQTGLKVELELDGVHVIFSDKVRPIIQLGRYVELTVTAKGENYLDSYCSPVLWEASAGDTGCAQVTLRGETGAATQLYGGCLTEDGDHPNFNGVLSAGQVKVESGYWYVEGYKDNRNTSLWCVKTQGGFTMTGGQVELRALAQNARYAGGVRGDQVTLLGGTLDVDVKGDGDYPAVYAKNTLTIGAPDGEDGPEAILFQRGNYLTYGIVCDQMDIYLGKLTVMMAAGAGGGDISHPQPCAVKVNTINASPQAELVVVKGWAADAKPLELVASGRNQAMTVNPLPDAQGRTAVLYQGCLEKPREIDNKSTYTFTFADAQGVERTVRFPLARGFSDDPKEQNKTVYWNIQNFAVLLPDAGTYTVMVEKDNSVRDPEVFQTTVTESGGDQEGGLTVTTAKPFPRSVSLPDETREWNGQGQTLSVSYADKLPPNTQITYRYDTPDGSMPMEPQETPYRVSATLTAPGYQVARLTGELTIRKRTLTVSAQAEDKDGYDGTTAAVGRILLDGAIGEDRPTATADFRFDTPQVGENKRVLVENITLDSPWDQHYVLDRARTETTASILGGPEVEIIWTEPSLTQVYGSVAPAAALGRLEDGQTVAVKITYLVEGQEREDPPTLPGLYTAVATVTEETCQGRSTAQFQVRPRGLSITALAVPAVRADGEGELRVENARDYTLAPPGLVEGDEVGVSYTVVYTDLTPGEGREVELWSVSLTGPQAGRYDLEDYPHRAVGTVLPGEGPGDDWDGEMIGPGDRRVKWRLDPDGTLTAVGAREGELLLAACYDDQNRLTALAWLTEEAACSLEPEASKVKLFWLDAAVQPLAPSTTVWGG